MYYTYRIVNLWKIPDPIFTSKILFSQFLIFVVQLFNLEFVGFWTNLNTTGLLQGRLH